MSLLSLPPEIFDEILECLPTQLDRQQASLQLTRAVPTAPIPLHHLFEVIHLQDPSQVVNLHRRIRRGTGVGGDAETVGDGCDGMVRVLRVESFTADAEVVINLLALLNDVTDLRLCIGPSFFPEHLQRVLETSRKKLRRLELCFRPYVRKANYLPFLKGSYYDFSLSALARWPAGTDGLHSLSIIQQALPSVPDEDLTSTKGKFAQPLAFFSFQPLAELLSSQAMSHLNSLSVQIPSRDITPYLISASPRLTHIELSTCDVTLRALERLLVRIPRLTHLVLDGCNTVPPKGEPNATEAAWIALGKTCAAFGVTQAKEREKEVNERLQSQTREEAAVENAGGEGGQRKTRKGRKGVATATISIRGVSAPTPASPSFANPNDSAIAPGTSKVRIAPSPPALTSVCVSSPAGALYGHDDISQLFREGWEEGIGQLRVRWTRLKATILSSNGPSSTMAVLSYSEVGELAPATLDMFERLEKGEYPCPALCFAGSHDGPQRDEVASKHVWGCGHQFGRDE